MAVVVTIMMVAAVTAKTVMVAEGTAMLVAAAAVMAKMAAVTETVIRLQQHLHTYPKDLKNTR
jgi:ribosomal protein S15P/S13E